MHAALQLDNPLYPLTARAGVRKLTTATTPSGQGQSLALTGVLSSASDLDARWLVYRL